MAGSRRTNRAVKKKLAVYYPRLSLASKRASDFAAPASFDQMEIGGVEDGGLNEVHFWQQRYYEFKVGS